MKRSIAIAVAAAVLALVALYSLELRAPVVPSHDAIDAADVAYVSVPVAVDGERYLATVPEGSTVYEVMESLSQSGALGFAFEEHPSFGRYITAIGGKEASGGSYWTLYVNGRESDLGASTKVVASGDVVEWRYEKR